MGERHAVGGVDVERLGLGARGTTGRGVADMPYPHVADELQHMPGLEDIAYQALRLAQVQAPVVAGDDPGGVLAAVLEDREPIVEGLVHAVPGDDADDPAHITPPSS